MGAIGRTFVCVCLLVPAWGCRQRQLTEVPASATEVTADQLADCGKRMQITFPPSARGLYLYKVTGGVMDQIWLKAEVARGELPALVAGSPFARKTLNSDRRTVTDPGNMEQWKPGTARQYLSADTTLGDGTSLRILIDTEKPDKAVVYLQWSAG